MVKSKLDPLSEDDFEAEVKLDAAEYTSARRGQAQRDALLKENRKRRQQGLEPLKLRQSPVPRKRTRDRKRKARDAGILGSGDDTDDGTREDDEESRAGVRHDNDDLNYEGQIHLPFNPLYRLAGMKQEESVKSAATANVRQALHPQPHEVSPETLLGPPTVATKPPNVASERPNGRADGSSTQTEDQEIEEDCYDDEDAQVFLPGMKIASAPTIAVKERNNEAIEEAVYSDDEFFADTSSSSDVKKPRLTPLSLADDDVPPVRPDLFNENIGEVVGEPLYLGDGTQGVAVPSPLNRFLKEYQRTGVRFLYQKYAEGRGAILGDDMGLGKTIQVIAFLSAIMRKTGTKADHQRRKKMIRDHNKEIRPKHWPTALIVCPKFLLRNWERELQTWGYFEVEEWRTETWASTKTSFLHGFLDIVLASYESTRAYIEELKDMPFSVVIADEAHRLKEPRAAVTLAMKKIQCPSCFALSGTIIQNRLDEMWSILDFVDRGWAGTLKEWRSFVVNPIKKGHRHEGTVKEVVTAIMRLGVMHEKVMPHFYLRRDKRLIANELPDKRDLVVFCPLASKQIAAYKRFIASEGMIIRRERGGMTKDVQFIVKRNEPCTCGSSLPSQCCYKTTATGETLRDVLLKSINALSKVANHLGLLYHARDDSQHTREVNERIFKQAMGVGYDQKLQNVAAAAMDPDNCGKWKLLAELLRQWRNEDEGNKVLIFSNSVRLLKMIAEFISTDLSYPFEMLTGENPSMDQYILLISTMAGGVGLNLTAANKVVIFDPAWNPANDLQAMDRAFRLGQKRTVDVYRLIGQGTLEELMYERQIQKQQRSRQLNEGTFESRIHQGIDRGRTVEEQGELFGTHNIFKFDPEGFVPGRLERVRQAEDRFVQDLIETEHDAETIDDEMADEGGRRMRDARRQRDQAKAEAAAKSQRDADSVVHTVLGPSDVERPRKEDDVLRSFGINEAQIHDTAFRDSPEERKIYELGLKLLKTNPEIAATLKANDLGKIGHARSLEKKAEVRKLRQATDPDDEPWKERIASGSRRNGAAMLAELSD